MRVELQDGQGPAVKNHPVVSREEGKQSHEGRVREQKEEKSSCIPQSQI